MTRHVNELHLAFSCLAHAVQAIDCLALQCTDSHLQQAVLILMIYSLLDVIRSVHCCMGGFTVHSMFASFFSVGQFLHFVICKEQWHHSL